MRRGTRPETGPDGVPASADAERDRQPALPFDTEPGESPIGYVLTARARRAVAPESLPDLSVVSGDHAAREPFDPHDSRPARARALRRAGRSVEEVAALLDVTPEVVARWTDGVAPVRRRRHAPRPTPDDIGGRAEARDEALQTLARAGASDTALAGMVAGLAKVAGGAVTVTPPDRSLAVPVVAWLRRHGVGPDAVHLLVAAGPAVERDLAAQHWAEVCGVPRAHVTHAPLPDARDPDELRVTVRITDARLVTEVLGWRDALAADAIVADGAAGDREAG
jgi:hypothetical protein